MVPESFFEIKTSLENTSFFCKVLFCENDKNEILNNKISSVDFLIS